MSSKGSELSSDGDLISYRVRRAWESFEEAQLQISVKHYNASVNRLYYGFYYMVSALLLKNDIDVSTHSGIRNQFGLHFVKTRIVSKTDGATFNFLFDQRHKSDYEDFVVYSEDEILDFNERVRSFLENLEKIINS